MEFNKKMSEDLDSLLKNLKGFVDAYSSHLPKEERDRLTSEIEKQRPKINKAFKDIKKAVDGRSSRGFKNKR